MHSPSAVKSEFSFSQGMLLDPTYLYSAIDKEVNAATHYMPIACI